MHAYLCANASLNNVGQHQRCFLSLSDRVVPSVPPVEKWNRVQPKKPKKSSTVLESFPGCIECGEAVDADVKALQCEMCSEEVWKCAQCLGLNDEMHEFLASSTDHGLNWFCDKCEEIIADGIGPVSNKLLSSLHKLMEKSDLMMSQLTLTKRLMIQLLSWNS